MQLLVVSFLFPLYLPSKETTVPCDFVAKKEATVPCDFAAKKEATVPCDFAAKKPPFLAISPQERNHRSLRFRRKEETKDAGTKRKDTKKTQLISRPTAFPEFIY